MHDSSIRKSGFWCAFACLVVLIAARPAFAESPAQPISATPAPVDNALLERQLAPASTELDEYQIGPHDLIEISVFQVTEMSRTVRVNAQGLISLPLLGIVRAGGLSANELEATLAAKLSENLLQDPQVSVFIKEFASQRVVVEGSIVKLGVYPLTGKTTLMQVIAMASGIDPVADPTNIRIFRQLPDGKREVLTYDLIAIHEGKAEDPLIKGNDTVIVGRSASDAFFRDFINGVRGFVGFGTIPLVH